MAKDRMALLDLMRKSGADGDVDFLREGVKVMAEVIMYLEVSEKVGAGRCERTASRNAYRNGYRERPRDTRAGTVSLEIPRVRHGSYFPSLLEPRRRAEQALLSVVQEACVLGVSTRKVGSPVRSLGMEGISKSEVSRICLELDGDVERWRSRHLEGRYPCLWLDAACLKVGVDGRVTSQAVIAACGRRETGEREAAAWMSAPAGMARSGPSSCARW